MKLFKKLLHILAVLLLLTNLCYSQRSHERVYGGRPRGRGPGRGRRPNEEGRKSTLRQYSFTSSDVDSWLNSIFPGTSFSDSDSSTSQWSSDGYTYYFSSSSSSSSSSNSNENIGGEESTPSTTTQSITTTSQAHDSRPWRGMGSFTGDVRLQCFDKGCTKGVVQIYNREEKRWGTICADRWSRRESDVVCKYLQFRGSRKALRLKSRKLSVESRKLPIAFRRMRCDGDEKVLVECDGEAVTSETSCESAYFGGVVCTGKKMSSSSRPRCSSNQILCANQQKCIARSYVCDGMSDCPWGTDEEDCENTHSCSSQQFSCGHGTGKCIPNTYRCDGDLDCPNRKDEENCEDHLAHFVKTPNSKLRLASHRYNNGWRNVSPYLCAKKCREESSFGCVSFDYNKMLRECDLTTQTRRDVGVVPRKDSTNFDHYEISVPRRCRGFTCADLCLSSDQVCDGHPHCPNRADEANCTTTDPNAGQPWSIQITGGLTPMDGRIEVRRGSGQYGLICDLGWTHREASVACRQLGFRNGAVAAMPGLTFHPTNRKVVLSGLMCTGREQRLSECRHDTWGQVNCPMSHEAGVICASNEAPVRPSASPTISTTSRSTTTLSSASDFEHDSPSSATCGVKPSASSLARPRIVGGDNADAHEWPWQVAIWLQNQLLCGATLIDECWVLTAAHCFTRRFPLRAYTIRLGDHRSKANDGTEQNFNIQQLIAHDYDSDTHDNDIALIELRRKNGRCASLNEYVSPACIPTGPGQFPANHRCHIVGWGQTRFDSENPFTSVLKEAVVPLIADNFCRTQTVYRRNMLTENMMCAGYNRGGVDTCQGDSGGPLLCENNGLYYIWGVVSWGNGCAEPRSPGVYTKVSNYLDWIRRKTGKRF